LSRSLSLASWPRGSANRAAYAALLAMLRRGKVGSRRGSPRRDCPAERSRPQTLARGLLRCGTAELQRGIFLTPASSERDEGTQDGDDCDLALHGYFLRLTSHTQRSKAQIVRLRKSGVHGAGVYLLISQKCHMTAVPTKRAILPVRRMQAEVRSTRARDRRRTWTVCPGPACDRAPRRPPRPRGGAQSRWQGASVR
jgi:hypothetical protein